MAITTRTPATAALPPAGQAPLRIRLLGRSAAVMVTAPFAAAPLAVWLTAVAASPLTVVAPLVLPATGFVRAWADGRRRAQAQYLGAPAVRPYRDETGASMLSRVITIVRDPASWRDVLWLFLHSIVGCLLAGLSLSLFAAGVFYLSYPLLWSVTPHWVFDHPFGGLVHLHSLADATAMTPCAVVLFALWYVLVIPLARAELGLGRGLLGARPALRRSA